MSNITKFSRVANILLIIFPIFFAINVCSSIQTENIKVFDKVKENEEWKKLSSNRRIFLGDEKIRGNIIESF